MHVKLFSMAVAVFFMVAVTPAHAKKDNPKKDLKKVHKAIKKGDCDQSDHCDVSSGKGVKTTQTTNNGRTNSSSYKDPGGGSTQPGRNY